MERNNGPLPILTITGSDGTGGSGIQADIKTCTALGGYAVTVVTAVTVQDTRGIQANHPMPPEVIDAQMTSIMRDIQPQAAKVGMLCSKETVNIVANHLRRQRHVVLDAAFISSRGERMAEPEVVYDVCTKIMPQCDIVLLKISEAEKLSGRNIHNSSDLESVAHELMERYKTRAIIIRGGSKYKSSDLFCHADEMGAVRSSYYTIPDHTNCNTHGLAGTLSTSIATHLGSDKKLAEAVELAYKYIQTLTVFSVTSPSGRTSALLGHGNHTFMEQPTTPRMREIYNTFMQTIANNMRVQHDVSFYADALHITARYLAQVTNKIASKTPKQMIENALMTEATQQLSTTTRTIQDIAFSLGFASQSQFTKSFRRENGISPSKFRQKR